MSIENPNDDYAFLDLAKVNVFITQLDNITNAEFNEYYKKIKKVTEVRLLDIKPNIKLKYFNSQTFPKGRIFLKYSTIEEKENKIYLDEFEPYRKSFMIIGVGNYVNDIDEGLIKEFFFQIKKNYPKYISHSLILFSNLIQDKKVYYTENVRYYDGQGTDSIDTLESHICTLCENFLVSLDNYVLSYMKITLRSPFELTYLKTVIKTEEKNDQTFPFSTSNLSFSYNNKTQKKRNEGRYFKVLGNFYLLAGKYIDSLNFFTKSLVILKKYKDFLWLGSALQGYALSIFLLMLLEIHFKLDLDVIQSILKMPNIKNSQDVYDLNYESKKLDEKKKLKNLFEDFSKKLDSKEYEGFFTMRLSDSDLLPYSTDIETNLKSLRIPHLLNLILLKILSIYQFTFYDQNNTTPIIIFLEFFLRALKFMTEFFIKENRSRMFVYSGLINLKDTKLLDIVKNNYILKKDLINQLDKFFIFRLNSIGKEEKLKIYNSLISIYRDLGLKRKEAFFISKILIFESNFKNNYSLEKLDKNFFVKNTLLLIFEKKSSDINFSNILDFLFDFYNIDISLQNSTSKNGFQICDDISSLQILTLKLYLGLTKFLNDNELLYKIIIFLFTKFKFFLDSTTQKFLKFKFQQLLQFFKIQNINFSNPYWDPFLIRSLKIYKNNNRCLIPVKNYTLNSNSIILIDKFNFIKTLHTYKKKKNNDDFLIFNPFTKTENDFSNNNNIIVENVVCELKIVLQNHFAFPIQINDIVIISQSNISTKILKNFIRHDKSYKIFIEKKNSINLKKYLDLEEFKNFYEYDKSKNEKESNTDSEFIFKISIPPNSVIELIIPFLALSSGELKILGLEIQIDQFENQYFQTFNNEKVINFKKMKSKNTNIKKNFNFVIDELINNLKKNKVSNLYSIETITLKVIPYQPNLILKYNLIKDNSLKLLDGEIYSFSLTFLIESKSLSYLSYSYCFSFNEKIKKKLSLKNNSKLTELKLYEIKWYLMKNKLFKIVNENVIKKKLNYISDNTELTIAHELIAESDITGLKVVYNYFFSENFITDEGFVNAIEIPLNFITSKSLSIIDYNVIELDFVLLNTFKNRNNFYNTNFEKLILFFEKNRLNIYNFHVYSIVIIDIKNFQNKPMTLDIIYDISLNKQFTVKDIIEPQKISRFFIPVQKFENKNKNDFILENSCFDYKEDIKLKKQAWVTQNFLKKIKGEWKITDYNGNQKNGLLNFSRIIFFEKMIDLLVEKNIKILNIIYHENENYKILNPINNKFNLKMGKFYILKTKIINFSGKKINGILKRIPLQINDQSCLFLDKTDSMEKVLLFDGYLDYFINKELDLFEELSFQLNFTFLQRGEYMWNSQLKSINLNEETINVQPAYITCY